MSSHSLRAPIVAFVPEPPAPKVKPAKQPKRRREVPVVALTATFSVLFMVVAWVLLALVTG